MTSTTKFYDVTQIMWSCHQGNSIISLWEVITIVRIWPEKPIFWGVLLDQVQQSGTGTRYSLDVLQQCGKRVETNIQKVFSYVFGSYRGKTGRGHGIFASLNRVKTASSRNYVSKHQKICQLQTKHHKVILQFLNFLLELTLLFVFIRFNHTQCGIIAKFILVRWNISWRKKNLTKTASKTFIK